MTPKFTTPCYVQVDDPAKRREIYYELEEIGYRYIWNSNAEFRTIIFADNIDGNIIRLLQNGDGCGIDCGTNIDLFLALAAMRSDTDKGQWFTTKGSEYRAESWCKCHSDHIYADCLGGEFRRATAAEIIEHFNKKIK